MDGPVNAACREAYTALISAMADALRENGRKEEEARDLALFTIAVIEGGILLGRTFHSVEPLNTSKKFLSNMIQEKKEVNG